MRRYDRRWSVGSCFKRPTPRKGGASGENGTRRRTAWVWRSSGRCWKRSSPTTRTRTSSRRGSLPACRHPAHWRARRERWRCRYGTNGSSPALPAASAPGWPPARRATTPGQAQTWASIRGGEEGVALTPLFPLSRRRPPRLALIHRDRNPERRPAVEELGDRQRQIDAAVAHPLPKVVVPIRTVQRFRIEIDVHHVWHVGDPVGDAARRFLPAVPDHPDNIPLGISGAAHILDQHLVADPEAASLRVVRGHSRADERLQNQSVALIGAEALVSDADLDPFWTGGGRNI